MFLIRAKKESYRLEVKQHIRAILGFSRVAAAGCEISTGPGTNSNRNLVGTVKNLV